MPLPYNLNSYNPSPIPPTPSSYDPRTPEQKAYDNKMFADPEVAAAYDNARGTNQYTTLQQEFDLQNDIEGAQFFGNTNFNDENNEGKTIEQMQQELKTLQNTKQYKEDKSDYERRGNAYTEAQNDYREENPPPPSSTSSLVGANSSTLLGLNNQTNPALTAKNKPADQSNATPSVDKQKPKPEVSKTKSKTDTSATTTQAKPDVSKTNPTPQTPKEAPKPKPDNK
jgi:hypothetical protein